MRGGGEETFTLDYLQTLHLFFCKSMSLHAEYLNDYINLKIEGLILKLVWGDLKVKSEHRMI